MHKTRLLALTLLLLGAAALTRADDAVFVVNKGTKISAISSDDASDILLGNKVRFDDGTAVRLAVQTSGPVHEEIIHKYARRSTDQFAKYWKRLVFTGKGVMPQQCDSDAAVIDYVSKTPGGIGYVAKASATADVAVLPAP